MDSSYVHGKSRETFIRFTALKEDLKSSKSGDFVEWGTMDLKSSPANEKLISDSIEVVLMYNLKKIDPYTGAPVSYLTAKSAEKMIEAFTIIENLKKRKYVEPKK